MFFFSVFFFIKQNVTLVSHVLNFLYSLNALNGAAVVLCAMEGAFFQSSFPSIPSY